MEFVKNFDSKVCPTEKTEGSSGTRVHQSTRRLAHSANLHQAMRIISKQEI